MNHSRFKDRTYVGHGGGYPGNITMTLAQLDDKVGVIVLTNTSDSIPRDIARQLMITVGYAVAKAAKPAAAQSWSPAWSDFAGRYRSNYDNGIVQVVLLNKQLVLLPGLADAAETKVVLEPIGDGSFRLTAPTGGGAIGENSALREVARSTNANVPRRQLGNTRRQFLIARLCDVFIGDMCCAGRMRTGEFTLSAAKIW